LNENRNLIFYQQVEHYTAASDIAHFPKLDLPEVCFAGRSNVGKSSLINSICTKRSLARTSNTPGRTQLIHFYNIQNKLFLSVTATAGISASMQRLGRDFKRIAPCKSEYSE